MQEPADTTLESGSWLILLYSDSGTSGPQLGIGNINITYTREI